MTLPNASLFEQVDSTFPVRSRSSVQAAFLLYKEALAECTRLKLQKQGGGGGGGGVK